MNIVPDLPRIKTLMGQSKKAELIQYISHIYASDDDDTLWNVVSHINIQLSDISQPIPLHVLKYCNTHIKLALMLFTHSNFKNEIENGFRSLHNMFLKICELDSKSVKIILDGVLNKQMLDEKFTCNRLTLLHIMVINQLWDIVRLAFPEKANLVYQCDNGNTILLDAVSSEYVPDDILSALILPETINAQNDRGYTPLHMALHMNSTHTAKLLLTAGANPHVQATCGYYPLDIYFMKSLQLDPEFLCELVPDNRYHLAHLLIKLVTLWIRGFDENTNKAEVLKAILMNAEFLAWNAMYIEENLTDTNYQINILITDKSDNVQRMFLSLKETEFLLFLLTTCGHQTRTFPQSKFSPDNKDKHEQAVLDRIKNQLKEYHLISQTAELLQEQCCKLIRSHVRPLSYPSLAKLSIPQKLRDIITRKYQADCIFTKMQQVIHQF